MKKLILLAILLVGICGIAYGWGAGDGSNARQLQDTTVFYNNSGTHLLDGSVVILDLTATAASTLGAYVTRTTAVDSRRVVGVTQDTDKGYVVDGSPVVVITRGPVDTRVQGSSDIVYAGSAVGSTNVAGLAGGGNKLGVALETSATDQERIWIWVQPGLDN